MTSPIVSITTVHVPLPVITSVFLLVFGTVFLVYNRRRYRRTHDSSWMVRSVASGVIIALSTISLILYLIRHP